MSPHAFATSPAAHGDQRKWVNPTPGWVGVNIFAPDGKPTALPVEPGGAVWLTAEEERMTAEAPRLAEDNPFIKEWECPVDRDTYGEVLSYETRRGMLVLSDEPARPVQSERFIPEREETITGATVPEQPPVQGQPSPDEIVGTPDAVKANDEALAQREPTAEQPTKPKRAVPLS
jgi:hypothetical protein